MNVLKAQLRTTIATRLASRTSQRHIEKYIGVARKTIRRYARAANAPGVATGFPGPGDQTPPPRPPASDEVPVAGATSISACEPHRAWIEAQVALGRNAVSV